jgi:hypothetical protein
MDHIGKLYSLRYVSVMLVAIVPPLPKVSVVADEDINSQVYLELDRVFFLSLLY